MGSASFTSLTLEVLDGTKISSLFFAVEGPAPAIIMSHGVCPATKSDFVIHSLVQLCYLINR